MSSAYRATARDGFAWSAGLRKQQRSVQCCGNVPLPSPNEGVLLAQHLNPAKRNFGCRHGLALRRNSVAEITTLENEASYLTIEKGDLTNG